VLVPVVDDVVVDDVVVDDAVVDDAARRKRLDLIVDDHELLLFENVSVVD
jgi:hypothetical protein